MGKLLAAAVATALVLSACTEDPPEVGFEDLPEASESASPDAPAQAPDEIDVTTTPDEITPEWVTAVVNTLLAEYGEMEAEILAEPPASDSTLPQGYVDRLSELFDGQYEERRTVSLRALLVDLDDERDGLLTADQYGGLRFTAQVVQYAQPTCVIAVGRIDRSLVLEGGEPSDLLSAVALERRSAGASGTTNPTEWILIDELANTGPGDEPNDDETMMNATLADYAGNLDNSCTEDAA